MAARKAIWPAMDAELEARVDRLLELMPAHRKRMFGTSAWFLDSNSVMFAGIWADGVTVRVGKDAAVELIEKGSAEQFDPMGGRPMKEIVFLTSETIAEDADLMDWLERAAAFTTGMPPKQRTSNRKN